MRWRSLFTNISTLHAVEDQLVEVLRLDLRSYDLAHQALFDRGNVTELRTEMFDTDHQVNLAVRDIRQQLLVHSAVSRSLVDMPAMFTYMSVLKDIERIGEYAKHILEIADARTGRVEVGVLIDLADHGERIAGLLEQVITVFADRDPDRARRLLEGSAPTLAELDHLITALTITQGPGYAAVPRALYYRYLKRIASHLHDVLSSLVAPVDRLEYYEVENR